MARSPEDLRARARAGERGALGRLVSEVAARPESLRRLIALDPEGAPPAPVIGITGPPGVGKSTMIDQIIAHLREARERVAVLCVDPTSPFSGGAVLGDRIRMSQHSLDDGVFIRSFATRGMLGGLAKGVPAAAALLYEFGFTQIIVETVGVGQNETAVGAWATTTVVVLSPTTGDSIQAIKGGVLEIADVLAVNKSDLPGAAEAIRQLKRDLNPGHGGQAVPIVGVCAHSGTGIAELWAAVTAHREAPPAHDGARRWLKPRRDSEPPRQHRARPTSSQFPDVEHHTLPHILRHHATVRGDAPFLSWCTAAPQTFFEVDSAADRAAAGFAALGIARHDRVALMLPNCAEFFPLWFGLTKLGAVEVPINPDLKGRLLQHVLSNSAATTIVCHQSRLDALVDALSAFPASFTLITVGEPAADLDVDRRAGAGKVRRILDYDELIAMHARLPGREGQVHFSDPMAILYTSGTSGEAKGVVVSYEHAYVFADRTAHSLGMTQHDGYFSPLPLFHIDAQVFGTLLPMIYGGRATLMERFSASRYWDQIRESDSTVTNMLGAMIHMLWKQPRSDQDAVNPLRAAQMIPTVDFQPAFEERFDLRLVPGYGQTETSLVTYDTIEDEQRAGSCGRPHPGFELAIVDQFDRPVANGRSGEIVVRAEHPYWITTGYHEMPEATVAATRNLWFHTGDLGHLDEDGWLYFDGRIKDSIRRRGENISAHELESVINEHPAVIESAAVAVPSDLTEDDIKVYVVTRPGAELTPEELLGYCEANLPWFMVPRYVALGTELLPRTPSEKLAKENLREEGIGESWDREAHGYEVRRPPPASAGSPPVSV
jgi:crotonobetaine/carnitine-CoA ligase